MTIPVDQQDAANHLTGLAGQAPIETHISAVFVGQDTVWKLKKAVNLPFVDFSSIDSRRHFLHRELELNKPHASEIYRDVVPIGRTVDGRVTIGQGDPIDWVLRMAPIPQSDFLDDIAVRNALTPELLDRLADCVADAHATLPPVPNWDSAGRMKLIAEGNAKSALSNNLPREKVDRWLDLCQTATDALRPTLAVRAETGHVRRCHGDLHLGNLCLWNGAPVPFDALEFDEALATIDTAYDLAFLLMDLDQHVSRAAANRVMNRYAARAGDTGLVAPLPLFLSQRAMVRAHIKASMGQTREAHRLLQAALDYLQPTPSPRILAIGGLQGTGKSTLARALAPDLGKAPGALIVRSDEIRKRLFNRRPEERLPPDAYTEAVNEAVNDQVIESVCQAAAAGHSVIADTTFLALSLRESLAARLAAQGQTLTGVWLQAPLEILEARIAQRQGDASDATVAVLHRSAAHDPGPGDWHPVDATDRDYALAAIRGLLKDPT